VDGGTVSILGPVWLSVGAFVFVCSLRAGRSVRALRWGLRGVCLLWLVAGAGVNAGILVSGSTYSGFADGADVAFVRETWESLVVPNHTWFIGLLIVFEATAGLLVLVPGLPRRLALMALIGFNLAVVSFSWFYVFWSVPMVVALGLLLRADRRSARDRRDHPEPDRAHALTP
jgi:hypothetical protein